MLANKRFTEHFRLEAIYTCSYAVSYHNKGINIGSTCGSFLAILGKPPKRRDWV
jgi:hypothetical protein